jgi:glycerol uptake facilitator-like aquaporin
MYLVKALVVAFMGTFALVFIGAAAVVASDPGNFEAIALAHGFVIMAFAYSFGTESNSYLNTALTLGAVMAGEGSFAATAPVLLARFAGGTSGGLALDGVYGLHTGHSLGMTTVNLNVSSLAGGLWLEAIGTLFLITVFLNTALRGMASEFAPFTVGMTVAFRTMSFGPVTGAAVKPAYAPSVRRLARER